MFFLASWVVWFLTLWYLSSGELVHIPAPQFFLNLPIDKVLHWGYFGIGGALMAFFTLSLTGKKVMNSKSRYSLLAVGAVVGGLDEWHQSWCASRSGNDIGDLTADIVGTLCGLIIAPIVWRAVQTFYCNAGRSNAPN